MSQFVYFGLSSTTVSAAEMTAFLGIEPDEIKVRGKRFSKLKRVSSKHSWEIVCRDPGLRVDEQIARVLDRLEPHAARIAELVRQFAHTPYDGAVLEVVRYFDGDKNDEDDLPEHDTTDQPNKPNPFGWGLDKNVINFLATTGAILDVDEYDTNHLFFDF